MKDYNPKAKSKYIMYLDAKNLYAWALSECLPVVGFRWLSDTETKKC